jgi:hypothetical protein
MRAAEQRILKVGFNGRPGLPLCAAAAVRPHAPTAKSLSLKRPLSPPTMRPCSADGKRLLKSIFVLGGGGVALEEVAYADTQVILGSWRGGGGGG